IEWTARTVRFSALPAIGDTDGDGFPEIFVRGGDDGINQVIAFNHDGSRRWSTGQLPLNPDPITGFGFQAGEGVSSVSLYDLDGDGTPEIVYGTAILNADGTLRCNLPGAYGGGQEEPISDVADVDLDGRAEILAGSTLYRDDCTQIWSHPVPDTS